MNSKRRKKLRMEGYADSEIRNAKAQYGKEAPRPEIYDTEEETETQNPRTYDYEEYDGMETYDTEGEEAPSISDVEYDEVPLSDTKNDDDQTKAGKITGFIRGRWDDLTKDFKLRKAAKAKAYENYLRAKPMRMEKMYENMYNRKLEREMNPAIAQQDWVNRFAAVSSSARKIAGALGGDINPSRMMGFSGTVLGPLPTGVREQPQFAPQQRQINDGYLVQGRYPMPEKTMQPGIMGSQVPKYQSAPINSQGTTWSRVVKIDKYGKKRSYLRRTRVPDMYGGDARQMQPQQQFQFPGNVGFKQDNFTLILNRYGTGFNKDLNTMMQSEHMGTGNPIDKLNRMKQFLG